jgi:hypothetical protein
MSKYANFAAAVLVAAFLVACPVAGQSRDPLPVPDIPGYQTLKCDFHMHTMFSDGAVWPPVRVDEAWRQGLDAISVTDHIEYQPHKNDAHQHNRPYELVAGPARQMNLLPP